MITATEGCAAKTGLGSDCKCVSVALKCKHKLEMIQSPFKSMTTICISKEQSNYIVFYPILFTHIKSWKCGYIQKNLYKRWWMTAY